MCMYTYKSAVLPLFCQLLCISHLRCHPVEINSHVNVFRLGTIIIFYRLQVFRVRTVLPCMYKQTLTYGGFYQHNKHLSYSDCHNFCTMLFQTDKVLSSAKDNARFLCNIHTSL